VTSQITWRKSSRSQSGYSCVEVSSTLSALRDSKNTTGPALRANIVAMVHEAKSGRFDRKG
jgi:hypothetical protein